MEIVGHRGACGQAPENTLKSFAAAIRLGCQRAELDVQVTSDGVAVVIHDDTVDRTTNGEGRVDSFTLADLKRLDAGEGERIPTLREVMELCRGRIDLQIELKANRSPPLVADLIRRFWSEDKAVIASFELQLLDQMAGFSLNISCGLLTRDAGIDTTKVALEHGHQWICPRSNIVTERLVTAAHAAGLLVYAYHVNDPDTAAKLISWGIDAVGTDHPEMMLRLLSSKTGD